MITVLLCACMCASLLAVRCSALSVTDAKTQAEKTLSYRAALAGQPDVQSFFSGYCAAHVNDSDCEWYIIGSRAVGTFSCSSYLSALENYQGEMTATNIQKCIIAAAAAGEQTSLGGRDASSIGAAGLMSCIFGLLMLDADASGSAAQRINIINYLLSCEKSDGGWAIGNTKYSDTDVTSMALCALSPYKNTALCSGACSSALSFLLGARHKNGTYASYGKENAESTAQVIIAMCSYGYDPGDITDSLMSFSRGDGSFCHEAGGSASGMATYQAYLALCAYVLYKENGTALYRMSGTVPDILSSVSSSSNVTSVTGSTRKNQTDDNKSDTSDINNTISDENGTGTGKNSYEYSDVRSGKDAEKASGTDMCDTYVKRVICSLYVSAAGLLICIFRETILSRMKRFRVS
jgi:hypothetical protein